MAGARSETAPGHAHPAWYASHGYVVVVQDVRGRFASDGDFCPFRHEARDGYESVGGAFSLASTAGWASFLAVESAHRRCDEAARAGLLDALGAAPSLHWRLPLRDYASPTAPDTDFTARLCAVDARGRSTNLKEGIVRLRFRGSTAAPSPIEPGKVYRYTIPLGPIGVRLAAGERVRLDVSGSDFPRWDRDLNTGGRLGREAATAATVATRAVFHDARRASSPTLPVVA